MVKLQINKCFLAAILSISTVGSLSSKSLGAQETAQEVVILAEGEGSGGTSLTLEQVKALALADAKRNALEQAGTAVFSQSQVDNFVLTKDQIQTLAQGLVKVLEVVESKTTFDEGLKAFHMRLKIRAEVQVVDARELLERLNRSMLQEQKPTSQPLAFSFNILAWELAPTTSTRGVKIKSGSGLYHQVPLKDGGVLYSDNEFQIHFRPLQDAYVYGFNVDSQAQVYPLIPNPEGMSHHFLRGNQTYILPAPGKFYQLDHQTGEETIYFLASHQPLPELDYLLQKTSSAHFPLAAVLDSAVQVRGISRITQGQTRQYAVAQGVTIADVEELIQGQQSAVRVFKYQHR